MLLRHVLSKVCLLVALHIVSGQNYESEYAAGDGEGDHSDLTEDGRVDYSKYYSLDGSPPLLAAQGSVATTSGFVNPSDFYSFFSSPDFGESNKQQSIAAPKNPFVKETEGLHGFVSSKDFLSLQASSPRDYFEEAQRKDQQKKESEEDGNSYESKPGPSYISHKLPSKYSGSLVETPILSSAKPIKKPNNNPKKDFEQVSDKDYKDALLTGNKFKSSDYLFDYPSGKIANYNVGKSSSTVSQYPALSAIPTKPTLKAFAPTLTPYQKYSFQPLADTSNYSPKYLEALLSTVAPFNPAYAKAAAKLEGQASNNSPRNLKNCEKLVKEVPERDFATGKVQSQKMDCYVCLDVNTNSKQTECSYQSEPDASNIYAGASERYSVPAKSPDGFRYKRFSGDETDPYEYVRSRSLAAYKDQKPDEQHDAYNYDPEYYSENYEKSSSELEGEKIAKQPGVCQTVTKDSMTCKICKNPKTGGNYEQCSYTSQPSEKSYAYVTEKKYDSLDDKPEETKTITKTEGGAKPEESNKKLGQVLNEDYIKKYSPQSDYSKDFSAQSSQEHPQKLPVESKEDYSNESETQETKRYPKKYGSSEPVEDYKGKKPQNNRPERDYDSYNERRGEESREDSNTDTGYEKSKPSDKYNIEDIKENDEDPYGYNIHKEFAESRKRLNLVSSFDSNDEKPENGDTSEYSKSSAQEPRASGLEASSSYQNQDSAEKQQEDNDSDTESTRQEDRDFEKEIEEYHQKFFPEYAKQSEYTNAEESRESKTKIPKYSYPKHYNENDQQESKEVEEVLAEFVKKDRSNCKKAEKKGMTCYLCVDKNGIQHEECMYVSESKPKPTHIAYHEMQKIKTPNVGAEGAESKIVEAIPTKASLGVKPLTVATISTTTSPLELVAAASNEYETRVEYKSPSKRKTKKYKKDGKRSSKDDNEQKSSASDDVTKRLPEEDSEKLADDGPTQETPKEFQVGDDEGAFSDETRPVYSKALGVTLPKYMLEKSDFEKEFDDFSSSDS